MTLVAVAHGSRDPRAAESTAALIREVRAQRPAADVRHAFLELAEPLLGEVLSHLTEPAVVVPLLLSGGYHVHVDLPATAREHRLGTALGPDQLLVEALVDRLAEAGWRPGDAVVLAAAGSRDQRAVADSVAMGQLVSDALGTDVTTSFVSAAEPTITEAVRGYGRRPVAVATYLLAPGFFADQVIAASEGLPCSAPLGAHPAVARLVWKRYDEARGCAAATS
ncbi:sirohydrochlorin chelatase [Fodinicola feengrottensis]|uniref:CbiX/SirB N-terminal domain-containing protein n=1 Tax=Fodinicola feengrottensis TaxID=435914 RepID=A0ABP4TTV0_9ACTN|nr:sirohydrochlorin chelatase [Fodinicola feengrottensis]